MWFQERETLRTIECLINGRYEEFINEVDPLEWTKASELTIRMLLIQIMRHKLHDVDRPTRVDNHAQLLNKIGRCLEAAPRDVLIEATVDFIYKNYPDSELNEKINDIIKLCSSLQEDLEAELVRRELDS